MSHTMDESGVSISVLGHRGHEDWHSLPTPPQGTPPVPTQQIRIGCCLTVFQNQNLVELTCSAS